MKEGRSFWKWLILWARASEMARIREIRIRGEIFDEWMKIKEESDEYDDYCDENPYKRQEDLMNEFRFYSTGWSGDPGGENFYDITGLSQPLPLDDIPVYTDWDTFKDYISQYVDWEEVEEWYSLYVDSECDHCDESSTVGYYGSDYGDGSDCGDGSSI